MVIVPQNSRKATDGRRLDSFSHINAAWSRCRDHGGKL